MANIGSLVASLELESATFTRNMEKARRSLNDFSSFSSRALRSAEQNFRRFDRSVERSLKNMFSMRAVIGTVAGTAGLGLLVRRSIESADNLAKTADKIGVATDALQELRYAAELAGVQQNTLDMALQRFTRRAAEAASGTGEAKDALAAMGIELRGTDGALRPTEDLLGDVADAFQRIKSPADQVRLAFKLFDSEGVAMVNMLRNGSTALDDTRQKARDLGLVIEDDLLRSAEATNDSLTTLARVIEARFTRAILESATSIDKIATAVTEALPAVTEFFAEIIRRAETTAKEFRALYGAIESVVGFFSSPTSVQPVADLETRVKQLNDQIRETQQLVASGGSVGSQSLLQELVRARAELLNDIAERSESTGTKITISRGQRPEEPAALPPLNLPTKTTGGKSEAEKRAEKIQDVVTALEFERDQIGRTAREIEIYNALQRAGIDIDSARGEEIATLAGTVYDMETAQDALNKITERAQEIYEATRTPLEDYQTVITELNALLEAGAISQDTYARAVEQAQEELENAADKTKDLENVTRRAGETLIDVFENGQVSISGLIDLVDDLIRSLQEADAIGGKGSGGGGIGGLISSGIGALFGSSSGGSVPVSGGAGLGSIGNVGFDPSLFGFANGGSFKVGGSGGTDSQTVAFRATPGEMVDVRTPGQTSGGTVVNISMDARGAGPNEVAALKQELQGLKRDLPNIIDNKVIGGRRRLGTYDKTFR